MYPSEICRSTTNRSGLERADEGQPASSAFRSSTRSQASATAAGSCFRRPDIRRGSGRRRAWERHCRDQGCCGGAPVRVGRDRPGRLARQRVACGAADPHTRVGRRRGDAGLPGGDDGLQLRPLRDDGRGVDAGELRAPVAHGRHNERGEKVRGVAGRDDGRAEHQRAPTRTVRCRRPGTTRWRRAPSSSGARPTTASCAIRSRRSAEAMHQRRVTRRRT